MCVGKNVKKIYEQLKKNVFGRSDTFGNTNSEKLISIKRLFGKTVIW